MVDLVDAFGVGFHESGETEIGWRQARVVNEKRAGLEVIAETRGPVVDAVEDWGGERGRWSGRCGRGGRGGLGGLGRLTIYD